jgi:putative Mn2+ efflux pump MntP
MCLRAWCGDGNRSAARSRHTLPALVGTAVATSLDALAMGVTLAFMNVNILAAAVTIGLTTGLVATVGVFAGRWLGPAGQSTGTNPRDQSTGAVYEG